LLNLPVVFSAVSSQQIVIRLTGKVVPLILKRERHQEITDQTVILLPRAQIKIVVHKTERKYSVEGASTAIADARQETAVVGWKHYLVIPLERGSFRLSQCGIQLETVPVSAEDVRFGFAEPGDGSFNGPNIEVFHAGEDSAFVMAVGNSDFTYR
jgi:hypothetical protein